MSLGVDKSKEVVVSLAHVLNAVSNFAHKQGILSLYPVVSEAQKLVKTDWKGVVDEFLDFTTPEGQEVEASFKSELKLNNPNAQMKLSEAIDCVQEAVEIFNYGKNGVERAVLFYQKVKSLVGA